MSLVVAGCGAGDDGGSGSGEPRRGGTLSYAVNVEAASLDPASCGVQSFDRCAPIFGTLLRYDLDKKEFVGQMAESFSTTDGVSWTLKLRSGVKFSDGTPFDADAVVFNWDRVKDPATLSPALRVTQGMTWKATDPRTVTVTLDKPNYQLPWALVRGLSAIGSPTAIQKAGADVGNAPVGAGPFVLKKWTRNSQLELTRNPDYFETGLPYLDGLVVKVIGADDQRLNALRSGEIDVDWSLLTKDARAIEAEGGYDVYRVPLVGGTGLQFNENDAVVKDEGLRKAMLLAFDSAQINNAVYPGDAPVDAFLRPDAAERDDAMGRFPDKNLAEAQRLFDDYLARTGKSGETVTFTCYAGVPALEQVAQLIQSQMQQINGLTFKLNPVDGATLSQASSKREFQTIMGATLSQEMDRLYDVFHSEGALNVMSYANPKVDEALAVTRSSNDRNEVTTAYKTVVGEISKDGPLRTWRYQTGHLYVKKKVKGIVVAGTNSGASAYFQYAWLG
ncbi:ABC transporter substrate-binding protein [Phytohabitans suffuscus]|uniref:ABC transporter substrate-binding protein n=1 Tax=Phytohabitans suffuscus TaxID=624315 RepID=UPI0015658677|nr:ABC transporter substrate-binding protein [Phytohabitans suffuscus]